MLKHILLLGLLSFSTLPLLKAQSCGNIPITKLEENPDTFTTLITDYITLVTVFISGYVTSSPDTCLSHRQKDSPV